jgi:hypothetical protein
MTEPEETIEAKIIAILATAVPTVDVIGALSPVSEGEQKQSPDTYISVFVDVASQNLDWRGAHVPFTFSVRVTIHYANADDATGTSFRDTCRAVRTALIALSGDGCAALSGDGFSCDEFMLSSTQTAMDTDADTGGMAKTYNFTISGRTATTTTQGD